MEHIYKIDVTSKAGYYIPITTNTDDSITLSFLLQKKPFYVPGNYQIYLLGQSVNLEKATIKKECLPIDNSKITFRLSEINGAGCYYLVFFNHEKQIKYAMPLYLFFEKKKKSSSDKSSGTSDLSKMLSEMNRIFKELQNLDDIYAKKSDLPRLANYAKIEDLSRYALKSSIPDISKLISADDAVEMIENYFKSHNNDIDVDEVNHLIGDFIENLHITSGKDGHTPIRGTDYMNEEDINAINTQIESSVADYVESHKEELKGRDGSDGKSIKGEDGYTPVRGKDYMNDEDVANINSQIESFVADYVEAHKEEFKGEDGKSIKGDKGADGKSAYETWISLGNSGTEEDFIASLKGAKGDSIKGDKGDSVKGDKGDAGLSAYEIWLAEGNEGTTHDFLDSLKGQKGDKGDDGNVGEIHMEDYAKKQDLPNMENYVQDEELDNALEKYVKKDEVPESTLTSPIKASVKVGGVDSGKTYAKGTSFETILKEILNPTLYPTFTAPSATLTANGSKVLETGATAEITMTVALNRGAISPAYGTSGKRSGDATGYKLNGGTVQTSATFKPTVSESNKSFKATVNYAQGEQPKDSNGDDYSTPLASGAVDSNTITYEFVDALYANTASIGTVAKLALVSKSAKSKQFDFPAQTVANPEEFHVPASWTISAIQVLNTLSGKWENCASEFTKGTTTHNDAAGNAVNYVTYKDNRGYNAGSRSIKITWK